MHFTFAVLQVLIKIGTRVMATTGTKAMGIMAIMVTIIKDMEDMVAMIILVTTIIMDMVTTMVIKSMNETLWWAPLLRHLSNLLSFTLKLVIIDPTNVDQSGGYGKSPRRGGHTNSYKPY